MRYFLDTEFNEFGGELISLAMVSETGLRELYVATECKKPCPWVKENVLPLISVVGATPFYIDPDQFGHQIARFLYDDEMPIIIADWPDDISYFCKALITAPGKMIDISPLQFLLLRVDAYPTLLEDAIQHNALWDARALHHKVKPFALSKTEQE
jgi:hypothetical protein